MKFFSALLVLAFSLSSFAGTGVKSIIDDLTYSLNVEWDQEDQRFYNEQIDLYTQRMADLRAQGLSQEELMNSVMATVKNEEARREVREVLQIISVEKLTDAQALNILTSLRQKTYGEGASWNGNVVVKTAIITAIVIGTAVVLYGISGRKLRKLLEDCEGADSSSQTNTSKCERTSTNNGWWWN